MAYLGGVDLGESGAEINAHAPGVEWRQPGHMSQLFAIAFGRRAREAPAIAIRQFGNAASHDHARSEAFDIPFERGGRGLVEIVDVEDRRAFRGRVGTEIRQMAITAHLYSQPGTR